MVKGSGPLGPMLALIGMKPVKFLSESDFSKSITVQSEMFSLYAVGIVKGYKRETRSSIVQVVDFRGAPVVKGPSLDSIMAGGASASASATPSSPAPNVNQSGATGPIASATAKSANGKVIYFHID
jgi:hypothetical protein